MNIGLVGAGAIANFLLKAINQKQDRNLRITSIYVRDKEKYRSLIAEFGVQLFTDIEEFLAADIDIVVEAANVAAIQTLLPSILKKKDLVLISVGALADQELLTVATRLMDEYGHAIHLPSGAIGGLDLLQNAAVLGTVKTVVLTTRKPAESLVEENLVEEKVVFEGAAAEAIKHFPKNMNVSIVLSLAGIGIEKTSVRLIADPKVDQNVHQVDIRGSFGEASITVKNNPLPENPKTSYLAAMSILGTLQRLQSNLKLGG